uniref:Uncharacterized protein n=1 Tax=viral metagenome TaxID=1070528 RepID=A0A6C0JU00_9ZZZZ
MCEPYTYSKKEQCLSPYPKRLWMKSSRTATRL